MLLSVFPPHRHRHLPPSLAELKWSLFVLFYPAKQQDIAHRLGDERIHHYRLTCSAGEGPTVSYQIPWGWEWSEVVSHMKAWTSALLWGVFFMYFYLFASYHQIDSLDKNLDEKSGGWDEAQLESWSSSGMLPSSCKE